VVAFYPMDKYLDFDIEVCATGFTLGAAFGELAICAATGTPIPALNDGVMGRVNELFHAIRS